MSCTRVARCDAAITSTPGVGLLENYGINHIVRKFLPDLPNRSQRLGVDAGTSMIYLSAIVWQLAVTNQKNTRLFSERRVMMICFIF